MFYKKKKKINMYIFVFLRQTEVAFINGFLRFKQTKRFTTTTQPVGDI